MNNKRDITLVPHSVRDLLAEVSRAYLHSGNPSCFLKIIKKGVDQYIVEGSEGMSFRCSEDAKLYSDLSVALGEMMLLWEKKEDNLP
jgi:hypothetical protein